MNSVADIWKIVLSRLSQDLSETTISTWFDEVEAVSIKDRTLYLHCPNDFKRSTIESMFSDRIKDSLRDIYSADFDVKLLSTAESTALFEPEVKKSTALLDSGEFTFDTFVVGESNKMAYAAARGEIALEAVMADALLRGKALALPLCTGPGRMQARRVTDLSRLRPGRYGIPEPGPDCPELAPETIDLILVPGVAFDPRGGRVGQGGGYYDRFLPLSRALRVGVCPEFALLDRVPVRAHDQRMDAVVTPSATLMMYEE